MGDRTSASIEIRGEVPSYEAFLAICDELADQQIESDYNCRSIQTKYEAAQLLVDGHSGFNDVEILDGRFYSLEEVLTAFEVPYIHSHSSEAGIEPGGGYWSPDGYGSYNGDGPNADIAELEAILHGEAILEDLDFKIREMKKATGSHLPPFSIPETVLEQARAKGLLPKPGEPALQTYSVRMSETVFYEFDIEVEPGHDPEEVAEAVFVEGPKQEWFSHCEDRTVVSAELAGV